jgi:translation initiation factor 2 subunit 1
LENSEILPERGDIVLCTVREITSHGIYVDLDEYNGMNGFLHISEISTGWVRNIDRVAKVGQKLVLKVVRAEKSRREVDLSLRQVTNEERRNKLIEWKQKEKAMTILSMVKKKLAMDDRQYYELIGKLQEQYGSIYDALEDAAKRGEKTFASMSLAPDLVNEMVTAAKEKIASPKYEVGSIVEMSSNAPDGIMQIKKALAAGSSASTAAEIKMTYVGAPRYRVRVTADDYKQADKVMGAVLLKMEEVIGKHGSFTSKKEMSRKYGGA